MRPVSLLLIVIIQLAIIGIGVAKLVGSIDDCEQKLKSRTEAAELVI